MTPALGDFIRTQARSCYHHIATAGTVRETHLASCLRPWQVFWKALKSVHKIVRNKMPAHTVPENGLNVLWWLEWGGPPALSSSPSSASESKLTVRLLLSTSALVPPGSQPSAPRRWQTLLGSLCSHSHQPSLPSPFLDLASPLIRVTRCILSADLPDVLGHKHSSLVSAVPLRLLRDIEQKNMFPNSQLLLWGQTETINLATLSFMKHR